MRLLNETPALSWPEGQINHSVLQLVTRAAAADARSAAIKDDRVALVVHAAILYCTERRIQRLGFSDGEIAVLDVRAPGS